MPSFYGKTKTLEQAIDTVVGRTLDQLGLEHDLLKRWGDKDDADKKRRSREQVRRRSDREGRPAAGARRAQVREISRRSVRRSRRGAPPTCSRSAPSPTRSASEDVRRGRSHLPRAGHQRRADVERGSTPRPHASELDFLRAVAVARIAGRAEARASASTGRRAGWSSRRSRSASARASSRGPITRKSGLPISPTRRPKVKGQGMVELSLHQDARRSPRSSRMPGALPMFVDDETAHGEAAAPRVQPGGCRCLSLRSSRAFATRSARRAPRGRRRHRALPRAGSARGRAARERGAREASRRSHVLQSQHAHRGDERVRRLVPLLLVREARRAHARRAHDEARGGLARAREAHGRSRRPADRDPRRQRPAPRAAVLVLRGAAARLQAHRPRRAPQVLHRRWRSTSSRSTTA